ncbi:MAG: HAD-IA family hydrolase [Acidobacteriota bacterium]
MIKVVVFDFDGTLFDTRADITDAVNFARRQFGLSEHSIEAVTGMVGYGVEVLAERAFQDSDVSTAEALPVVLEYYRAHPGDKAVPYPGVRETLPKIEAIRTIVSNKPEQLIRTILQAHSLETLFRYVAGGDTFSVRKPDPFPIRFIQAEFNTTTDEILIVGDHVPDLEMARRTGAHSVFCRYGFGHLSADGAQFEIDRFSQILDVLEQLGSS